MAAGSSPAKASRSTCAVVLNEQIVPKYGTVIVLFDGGDGGGPDEAPSAISVFVAAKGAMTLLPLRRSMDVCSRNLLWYLGYLQHSPSNAFYEVRKSEKFFGSLDAGR